MPTIFDIAHNAAREADAIAIKNGNFGQDRTQYSVLASVTSELGELAQEVTIENGHSYKQEGDDGVVGEAIDVILSTLDLILITVPHMTEKELVEIAQRKSDKWIRKLSGNKD